jgi:WD40 repeat protein
VDTDYIHLDTSIEYFKVCRRKRSALAAGNRVCFEQRRRTRTASLVASPPQVGRKKAAVTRRIATMSTFGMAPAVAPATTRPGSIAPTDHNVAQAGGDGVSSLTWSPTANILVSGNWDSGIRCWEVQEQSGQILASPKAQGACE